MSLYLQKNLFLITNIYRLTDLWKRIKSRHLYLCIHATVCGLRWRLTNLRDKWRNEFCGKIYGDIDYSHRMVQSKSRLNEWKTCLVKIVQFYVHIRTCTSPLHFPRSSQVLQYRLFNSFTDCWLPIKKCRDWEIHLSK